MLRKIHRFVGPLALALALLVSPGQSPALAAQEPLPPAGGAAPAVPAQLTADRLADEIDLSIRWLRTEFDPATGTYGALEPTAAVLSALAASPRRYRYHDGPFVGRAVDALLARQDEDGWFREPGADDEAAKITTEVVHQALLSFRGVPSVDRALLRLVDLGFGDELKGPPRSRDAKAAADLARALLAERRSDGSFQGAVLETARAVSALSGAHRDMAEAAPRAAAREAQPLPPFSAADQAKLTGAQTRGALFLAANPAKPEVPGRFGVGGEVDAGITAMVVGALLTVPAPRPEEVQRHIDAGLAWLRSLQQEDGSIHDGRLANYVTSAAVMALAKNGAEEDLPRLLKARAFLQRLQADGDEGYDESHRYWGGIGYGGDERPDLSNLQMALEALAATGLESEDETFQRALVFLQRTQNRTESNDLVLAEEGTTIRSGDDGGAAYAPGESKAGFLELPDGTKVPRSYGSMTYALLRGYLFAGLPKTDARVQAAWKWLTQNYTLDVNPGFDTGRDATAAYQGLFYYFASMAKALDAFGEEVIVDGGGVPHPWRAELAGRMAAMQRPDGSWINLNSPRWWEGNPVLATAYALVVLDAASPRAAAPAKADAGATAPAGAPADGGANR